MNDRIEIREAGVACGDAVTLLEELNETLTRITGASGAASFAEEDTAGPRAVFLIAYVRGEARGCGALRGFSEHAAEIKRVYARPNTIGVGSAIVKALEEKARALGYADLLLETRRINTAAVAFYRKLGYVTCPNFGKYAGRADAVCMIKKL